MNRLQRSVVYKREKRQLEKDEQKKEIRFDVVAEVVGLVFAVGALVLLYIVLNDIIN